MAILLKKKIMELPGSYCSALLGNSVPGALENVGT